MSYTTKSKIEAYFTAVTFDSTTSITDTEVDNWISQASNLIDGVLNERYVLPVTDASDLSQLEALADMYIVPLVKQALGVNQLRSVKEENMKTVMADQSQFFALLEKYRKGFISLINTANNSSKLTVCSYNQANDIEPTGKMGEDQY